jgi:hypothetical protein
MTPTPNTFSLNTAALENRGNFPRLYPITGLHINLFAFSSTPLNLQAETKENKSGVL